MVKILRSRETAASAAALGVLVIVSAARPVPWWLWAAWAAIAAAGTAQAARR